MFSIDGLVSGFDTTSIINGLLQFQQTQVDLLNSRKSEITTRQSAFNGIEAQLLNLRSALGKLNRVSSVFDSRLATSSNEDTISAIAGSDAAGGVYSITVNALAQAEQLGSQGFESENAELATGEITLRVGSRPPTTIQLDSSNNTVADFVSSVNAQSDDIAASIVFDQSNDSFRVLLTSSITGEENAISIDSDLGAGAALDFSGEPVQNAQNASITLGSGPGAIEAEYADNQIDELISGVTLNLASVSTDPVIITVSDDNEAAVEAIEDFVEAFNGVVDFIDNQTQFDPETDFASPLAGNRNVNLIRDRLLNSVIENVDGLDTGLSRLADIGIDVNTTGRLELDTTQLNDALAGRIEGVAPSDIRNLFGLNGTSSSQGIEFLLGSDLTSASGEPFQVEIIQAAEQASVSSSNELLSTVVIDGDNNEFSISVDGVDSEVLTLAQGEYTPEELAAEVQSVINNSSELGSRGVTVSADGLELVITTESYGLSSTISNITGSAAESLGFSGTEEDAGQDVAGTFIVNGQSETAVGNGRLLVGNADNENTADLQLLVSLTGDQVGSGLVSDVQITRGITSQLDSFLGDILDPETGTLKTINDDFDEQIESLDKSIERVQEQTDSRRDFLIAEFAALERVLSELQNTGNLLSSQLQSLGSFSPS